MCGVFRVSQATTHRRLAFTATLRSHSTDGETEAYIKESKSSGQMELFEIRDAKLCIEVNILIKTYVYNLKEIIDVAENRREGDP